MLDISFHDEMRKLVLRTRIVCCQVEIGCDLIVIMIDLLMLEVLRLWISEECFCVVNISESMMYT